MVRCPNPQCGLLWLDPMPAEEDIGDAYAGYYTHAPSNSGGLSSPIKALYSSLKRHYCARRLGYPAHFIMKPGLRGALHSVIMPLIKLAAVEEVRFLRFVPNGTLLDVGCGSGEWLSVMKELGWNAEGVDFDRDAVNACAGSGLTVHPGSVQDQRFPAAHFDAVTLNHVIEHVPDPVATLEECMRILKPGGTLVMLTPNAGSICHRVFKSDWRGLEPPRHLHLFSMNSMRKLLDQAHVRHFFVRTQVGTSLTYESFQLRRHGPSSVPMPLPRWRSSFFWRVFSIFQHAVRFAMPAIGECLVVVIAKADQP
jgi:2-polyprenyl-3-methyl-5-hydroxy-6-metoxy-1,4-benzoquinol methylase